jgi:hypothetical protein
VSANEQQTLRDKDEYSRATKIFADKNKHESRSLEDTIRIFTSRILVD